MAERELAREGEWTVDGRFIAEGALTWGDEPLPLFDRTGRGDGMEIGQVTDLRREGNYIYGNVSIDAEAYTIDVDHVSIAPQEDGSLYVTEGRIAGVWQSPKDEYPWKDDE